MADFRLLSCFRGAAWICMRGRCLAILLCILAVFPIVGFAEGDVSGEAAEGASDVQIEEGDSYGERVRMLQAWLQKRRMEREHSGWARDLVPTPPKEYRRRETVDSGEDYFSRHDLDERGYRRLTDSLRVRIRGLHGEKAHLLPEEDADEGGAGLVNDELSTRARHRGYPRSLDESRESREDRYRGIGLDVRPSYRPLHRYKARQSAEPRAGVHRTPGKSPGKVTRSAGGSSAHGRGKRHR